MSGRKVKRREDGLPHSKPLPAPKDRIDVAGLLPQADFWDLKAMVLARPGGEVAKLRNGHLKLVLPGRCERCGDRPCCDAHHRKLVSQGGPDRASNLAALCRQCHDWCHAHPDEARLGGWILRPNDDPLIRALCLFDGSIVTLDDEAGYSFQQWPGLPVYRPERDG